MKYEFRTTQTSERNLMAVHAVAKGDLPQQIERGLDQVWAYLKEQGAKGDHNVVVYRSFDHATGVMTIDAGVQVEQPLPGNGTVVPVTTPGGLVATTVHLGPYQKLGDASSALHQFCSEHDHPIAGPTWEDYDHWTNDPTQLRTDVFVVIAH